jgi:hypothetical protein
MDTSFSAFDACLSVAPASCMNPRAIGAAPGDTLYPYAFSSFGAAIKVPLTCKVRGTESGGAAMTMDGKGWSYHVRRATRDSGR